MIRRVGKVGDAVFLISGETLASGTLERDDECVTLSGASVSRSGGTEFAETFSVSRADVDGVLYCKSERGRVLHDFVLKVVFIDEV